MCKDNFDLFTEMVTSQPDQNKAHFYQNKPMADFFNGFFSFNKNPIKNPSLTDHTGEHITDIYITETGTTELENLSHNIIDIFVIET